VEDFLCFHVFIPKHTGTHTPYINWLVVAPYPSEKWWSSSIGMMTFPIYGKMKVMFQTTNYYIPLKTPLNPIKKPMSSRCSRDATNDLKDDPCPGHTDVHHVPSSWFITSPMHTDTLYIISVTYNMYLYIYAYIRVYYIYMHGRVVSRRIEHDENKLTHSNLSSPKNCWWDSPSDWDALSR